MKAALYPGRFQPFHFGHITAIKEILKQYLFVIIGVRKVRVDGKKNVFNSERVVKIINIVLAESGISSKSYKVVVIPDMSYDWYSKLKYLKFDVVFAGNPALKKPFRNHCKVFHLSRKNQNHGISATNIRSLIKLRRPIYEYVGFEAEKFIYDSIVK